MDCADYVEAKLEELETMLRARTLPMSTKDSTQTNDGFVPKSGAK